MLDFSPERSAGSATLVEQIVAATITGIETRRLRVGMRVPSVREFARSHNVSTFTVASAYARLVAQGWLQARRGAGYRVALPGSPATTTPPAARDWQPPQMGADWLLSDVFADHSIPVKAGCGWLPPQWVNETGLHQALRQQARAPGAQIAGYGHPCGHAALRDHIALELADQGLAITADQVLLTQGATQALDLITRTLLKPGDTVVVEAPCYTNLLQTLRLAGMRIVAVPCRADGLDMAALEAVVVQHKPRVVFVNPVLHNPTGATLSMHNAFRLLQIAERHDMWVVEDDVSRLLLPGVAPLLAALDGAHRVIHVGSYAKSISPSLRVGYAVAARDLIRALARTKMAVGLTSPQIMERIVLHMASDGQLRQHVARVREKLAEAHSLVARRMTDLGMDIYTQPGAGLFLWARLGERSSKHVSANQLARQALADGIWLAPGSYFDADERDTPWLRFNVAYSEDEALWRFLDAAAASVR